MQIFIKMMITLVITAFMFLGLYLIWCPKEEVRTGTRSYYAEGRNLVANVHGEYLGNFFVPMGNVFQSLTQEQIDSIVLIETIKDNL